MRSSRLAPLAAALTVTIIPVAPSAAHAARPTPAAPNAPADGIEHVLLALTPHDRGLLHALAAGKAPAHAQRAAALAAALPSAGDIAQVADTARALGLTVDATDRLSVSASGPAAVVNSLFGSARAIAPRSHAQHPLPHLPAAFRGKVTAAFGGDDKRPAFRHFTTTQGTADGGDFRTAYGNSVVDPTVNPGVTQSIATIQLSGWHSSDLTQFANDLRAGNASWPNPVYVEHPDPQDPPTVVTDPSNPDYGADQEVDLDQEALYSIAPYAYQRAFTSGNDFAGMLDSLVAIGDAASNADNHIVAASISWGQCEDMIGASGEARMFYSAFEDALAYVLSNGVTVFAATGDSGSDCISYPASSPQVVAVGGTQMSTPSDRTTATGWVEDPAHPTAGSSGGGPSTHFARPPYQRGVVEGPHREIPDISALAGRPGFSLYTTSPANGGPGYTTAGGTSLASPVATATFVGQLGAGTGVGDIHAALYAQRTDPSAFFDVTSSASNGADAARPGYDMVTGIGTPVWSAIRPQPQLTADTFFTRNRTVALHVNTFGQSYTGYRVDLDAPPSCSTVDLNASPPTSFTFPGATPDGTHMLTLVAVDSSGACHYAGASFFLDRVKPKVTAKLLIRRGSTRNVVTSWASNDPNGSTGSGVLDEHVTLVGNGRRWHPTASPFAVTGASGRVYAVTVKVTDFAGNVAYAHARLLDDRSFTFSKFWSRAKARAAYGGSQAGTTHSGATARFSAAAKAYVLYVERCASCGRFGVYTKSGHLLKVVDTYAARTRYRVPVTIFTSKRYAARTLVVRALGTKRARSSGVQVNVDGLTTRD